VQIESPANEAQPAGWRMGLALCFIILSFSSTACIPLVAASGLPAEWKATLSGLLFIGIPQVFMVTAAAIAGKAGFNYLKGRIFGFFKQFGPPKTVSPVRYRIGLVMFLLPLLLAFFTPYVAHLITAYEANRVAVGLAGDVLFIASFFVLGGDFWEKVRALFVHGAEARFAEN